MQNEQIPAGKIKKRQQIFIIAAVALIFIAVVASAYYSNIVKYGGGYVPTPDGDLYLSIAENYLNTGHFMQTSNTTVDNFVVPPGLPAIYTALLFVGRSVAFVVGVQYILYGLTALLLMFSGANLCKGSRVNVFIPAAFTVISLRVIAPNPGMLLTEVWTIFLLAVIFYVYTCPKLSDAEPTRLLVIFPLMIALLFIRPALGALLILPIVGVVVEWTKHRLDRRFAISVSAEILVFALLLCVNIAVNKRETGYTIIMENYGAATVYQANNINTKTYGYSTDIAKEFTDDYYWEVHNNTQLDMQQKNELLSMRAKEFIKSNP